MHNYANKNPEEDNEYKCYQYKYIYIYLNLRTYRNCSYKV